VNIFITCFSGVGYFNTQNTSLVAFFCGSLFYLRSVYGAGRFFFRDDGCDGKTTLGVTAELHYEQNVDVYVGMPCSAGPQRQYYGNC